MTTEGCKLIWVDRLLVKFKTALKIFGAIWFLCNSPMAHAATSIEAYSDSAGPMVYAIEVTGNRLTSEVFIRREMRLKPGVRVTSQLLEEDRLQLLSLGLFNRVKIEVRAERDRAVVWVEVSEPFYLYLIPSLRVDTGKPKHKTLGMLIYHRNFRGYGEHLGGSFWVGSTRGLSLFHRDPWFSWGGKFGLGQRVYYAEDEAEDSIGNSVRRTFRGGVLDCRIRTGRRSWVDIETEWMSLTSPTQTYTMTPGDRDRVLILRNLWTVDHRDYWYYPTRGYYINIAVMGNRVVDLPHNFYQERLDFRRYRSFKHFIIAGRLWGTVAQESLPPYYSLATSRSLVRAGKSYESRNGAIGVANLEIRFNLRKKRYYSFPWVPIFNRYLENLQFSIEGVVLADRGVGMDQQWKLVRDLDAFGAGLQFQVPFLETVHILAGWSSHSNLDHPSISIGEGVTF